MSKTGVLLWLSESAGIVVVVVVVAELVDGFVTFHTDFLPFFTQVNLAPLTSRVVPAGEHEAPGDGDFAALAELSIVPTAMTARRASARVLFMALTVQEQYFKNRISERFRQLFQ
jgi:hypothetical protein